MKDFIRIIARKVSLIGPGLFCLGITVGTGSVTSMVKSGSVFGTALLWVLALSAFFSGVMTYSYGKYAISTGETAIHSIKSRVKGGKIWAIILIIGLSVSQWISLSSILNITSNAVLEVTSMCVPGLSDTASYWIVVSVALLTAFVVWTVLSNGKYSTFEKILSVLVTFMGLSFIISMFIELPDPKDIVHGFVPSLPESVDSRLFIAAFVGTTMAAPAFILRPLMLKSKEWGCAEKSIQTKDSILSASLSFMVSASIMICSAGVLFSKGMTVEKVLDMIYVLQPMYGRFAVALFVVGLICAGLSSIFPLMMLTPVLIDDYQYGEMRPGTRRFKLLAGLSAFWGMTIPILGSNPIFAQILSQVTQVFVLPLVILMAIILLNQKSHMGENKATIILNIFLALAFIFSCIVSYTAFIALKS